MSKPTQPQKYASDVQPTTAVAPKCRKWCLCAKCMLKKLKFWKKK